MCSESGWKRLLSHPSIPFTPSFWKQVSNEHLQGTRCWRHSREWDRVLVLVLGRDGQQMNLQVNISYASCCSAHRGGGEGVPGCRWGLASPGGDVSQRTWVREQALVRQVHQSPGGCDWPAGRLVRTLMWLEEASKDRNRWWRQTGGRDQI